jgi:replication-associated recombination protein RarA
MSDGIRFAEIETPGGYLCGEVASALQKEIRRGNEREALFWATELDLAGFGRYVFKRLRIIASEDVGVADSNAAVQVWTLYQLWNEAKKKKGEPEGHSRIHLLHAVVLLARAPKSRMLDHALMVFYGGDREPLPVPDYALDMHTKRGRQLGRGLDHFFEEGAQLVNETIDDPYAEEGRAALTRPNGRSSPHGEQLELEP